MLFLVFKKTKNKFLFNIGSAYWDGILGKQSFISLTEELVA